MQIPSDSADWKRTRIHARAGCWQSHPRNPIWSSEHSQSSRWRWMGKTTPKGFEPLRAEPNGFLVHHLNHSVTVSLMHRERAKHSEPQATAQGGHGEASMQQLGRRRAQRNSCAWALAQFLGPDSFVWEESDTEGIRTLAGRAQWISSPSP